MKDGNGEERGQGDRPKFENKFLKVSGKK